MCLWIFISKAQNTPHRSFIVSFWKWLFWVEAETCNFLACLFKRDPIMLFHFLNFSQCVVSMFGHKKFPFDISLILRRVSTLVWEKLFFPIQSRSYNCTSIGSCRIEKRTNARANGYAARQNGRGVWLYNQLPCHRISDFFEGSNRGVPVIARPGMQYSFPYLREFIFIYI